MDHHQSFWLRLSLITVSDGSDPTIEAYIHPDIVVYHSDKVEKLNDGSICIPITQLDFYERKIE